MLLYTHKIYYCIYKLYLYDINGNLFVMKMIDVSNNNLILRAHIFCFIYSDKNREKINAQTFTAI